MRPMPRYIEENEIYKLFNARGVAQLHVGDIDVLPRADVVEVVHGKAVRIRSDIDYEDTLIRMDRQCDECDALITQMDNYCPNCGAKMEEKVEYADD
jgi:hypothetical protein